jgi:hypothetical protein
MFSQSFTEPCDQRRGLFAEWLASTSLTTKHTNTERCATMPKITGSNPSGGNKLTFRSDLLLTARGGST